MNINIDRQIAASSAAGVAIHTPVTPRSAGSTSIASTKNTKDLENASIAEINPFDSAVKSPLAKTLKPMKTSAAEQIRFPVTARAYTGFSGLANTDTKGSVTAREAISVTAAMVPIIFKLR